MTENSDRDPLPRSRPRAELFCIYAYAGGPGRPCGWRGAASEAWGEPGGGGRRCPRCGRTTLLELPAPPAAE